MSAVTFDFGQTLAELDLEMLCQRVAERGAHISVERAGAATTKAWTDYNDAKRAGIEHDQAWQRLMQTLLTEAGVENRTQAAEIAAWLWDEQPKRNLWRKPIAGMLELVRELHAEGVVLGIISNSEGHIAELTVELGIDGLFSVIADSGALGFEKPDPRIFNWAAERIGLAARDIVHVGDAWEADVVGALRVGARAIWFSTNHDRALPAEVQRAGNATETRAALRAFGVG